MPFLAIYPAPIFCRRRHQPRRPPLAKINPGRPAPAIGPGTATPLSEKLALNLVSSLTQECLPESRGHAPATGASFFGSENSPVAKFWRQPLSHAAPLQDGRR